MSVWMSVFSVRVTLNIWIIFTAINQVGTEDEAKDHQNCCTALSEKTHILIVVYKFTSCLVLYKNTQLWALY